MGEKIGDSYRLGTANTGDAVDYKLRAFSRGNLIANWYLEDPINTRGSTSYTAAGFCIDGWNIGAGTEGDEGTATVEITASGTRFTASTWRAFEFALGKNMSKHLRGEKLTFSVVADGNLLTTTTTDWSDPNTGSTLHTSFGTIRIYDHGSDSDLGICATIDCSSGGGTVITACKLEIGPVQTLTMDDGNGQQMVIDAPPNYALSLLTTAASGETGIDPARGLQFLRAESGSYTGTGHSGARHKNTITFSFVPKIVYCYPQAGTSLTNPWEYNTVVLLSSLTDTTASGVGFGKISRLHGYLINGGKGFGWYFGDGGDGSPDEQFNTSGVEYYWLAIG